MAMVWLKTSLNVTTAPPRAGSLYSVPPPPPIIPEPQRRLHARSFPYLQRSCSRRRKALPQSWSLEALSTCISHHSIAHLLSYEVAGLRWIALVKPQVRWRAVSPAAPRTITFDPRQLQRKFKHAVDFGVMGKYSRQRAAMFERVIRAHIEDETTLMIPGTYRGEPVTHFVNPQTD